MSAAACTAVADALLPDTSSTADTTATDAQPSGYASVSEYMESVPAVNRNLILIYAILTVMVTILVSGHRPRHWRAHLLQIAAAGFATSQIAGIVGAVLFVFELQSTVPWVAVAATVLVWVPRFVTRIMILLFLLTRLNAVFARIRVRRPLLAIPQGVAGLASIGLLALCGVVYAITIAICCFLDLGFVNSWWGAASQSGSAQATAIASQWTLSAHRVHAVSDLMLVGWDVAVMSATWQGRAMLPNPRAHDTLLIKAIVCLGLCSAGTICTVVCTVGGLDPDGQLASMFLGSRIILCEIANTLIIQVVAVDGVGWDTMLVTNGRRTQKGSSSQSASDSLSQSLAQPATSWWSRIRQALGFQSQHNSWSGRSSTASDDIPNRFGNPRPSIQMHAGPRPSIRTAESLDHRRPSIA
ncbi:hypothetical protein BC831DRAFT_492696 [Entophlyctis helioformis]|nr:hypothetical protein BC831DRAFT_492696 [Entophlyctis helioformis]